MSKLTSKFKIKPEWKLPPEFKTKWVKALRSGKYIQGRDTLLDDNGQYCCLGVACAIQGVNKKHLLDETLIPFRFESLPIQLREQELGGVNPLVSKLTTMNDDTQNRFSFKKIASYIERYL